MQLSLNTCMQNETSETAFSAINERFLIKQILEDKQCTMKIIINQEHKVYFSWISYRGIIIYRNVFEMKQK